MELKSHELFAGAPPTIRPYNFHFDEVAEVPPGWALWASSENCRVHAVGHGELPAWGLQFHPEVAPDEGAANISGAGAILARYGLDAAAITAEAGRAAGYYPEIVRNFVASCAR